MAGAGERAKFFAIPFNQSFITKRCIGLERICQNKGLSFLFTSCVVKCKKVVTICD